MDGLMHGHGLPPHVPAQNQVRCALALQRLQLGHEPRRETWMGWAWAWAVALATWRYAHVRSLASRKPN